MPSKTDKQILAELERRQAFHSPYIPFAKRFPPGVDDPSAMARAAAFAEGERLLVGTPP